ncbi:hypothetical protein PF003_g24352 [Phytophthora fragariae]|nr:hypothetical protein PF003_g24352 [Phytophthora fragariae]
MSGSDPETHVPSVGVWKSSPITKEWHESWEAFYEYLKVYQADTHQLFRLRSSTSVARRNAEIKAQAGADLSPELVPEEFKTYWVKLICTHGWRRKSRSTGQRKSIFNKSTQCKADVKAAVAWNNDKQQFMIRTTGYSTDHNHRVDAAAQECDPA